MASLRGKQYHPLLAFFLVFSSIPLLSFASHSGSQSTSVTMSVYYEALCPYCADFIVNHLVKVFDDQDLISIVNLRMIPWGNAYINPDGSFACQHGPNECFLNAIEACAINTYPDLGLHFRFIYCIESLSLAKRLKEWVNCFEMTGLDRTPIDCYTAGHGNAIEQNYAAETAKLNPPHRFVPWVIVDDQPLLEDFKNFVSYICKAYKGNQVPQACKSLPLEINSIQEGKPTNLVCYADEMRNITSSPPALKLRDQTHD